MSGTTVGTVSGSCPLCGGIVYAYLAHQCTTAPMPAMTTAAPPEKMMDELAILTHAQLSDRLYFMANTSEWANNGDLIVREAARRLAPRVGDKGRVMRAIYEAHRGEWGYSRFHASAEGRARAQRNWDTLKDRKPEEWASLEGEADAVLAEIGISAPPAASAERDGGHQPWCDAVIDLPADRAVCNCGYRKRAGQGVFIPQSVWDWLMGEGDSFVDPEPPHQKYKRNFWWRKELRKRLSALPKGQEHEGEQR